MKLLDKINNEIDRFVKWLLIVLMIVIHAVMLLQVIVRYVFNYPLSWAEEFVRICFVWVVFMSASAALRRGEIVAMDFFVSRLSKRIAHPLSIIARFCVLVFLSFAIYSSYEITSFVFKRGSYTAAMQFPLWIVYLAIPVGCFFMLFHLCLGLTHECLDKSLSPQTQVGNHTEK